MDFFAKGEDTVKRFFCVILTLSMLLPVLAACGGGGDEPPVETPAATESVTETDAATEVAPETVSETDNETEDETVPETETEPETEPVVTPLELIRDGQCLYTLITPSASNEMVNTAYDAVVKAVNATFGVRMEMTTDKATNAVHGEYVTEAPELLLGQTNRLESREVFRTLSAGQYAIRAMGNKIVIVGYTDNLTLLAAEAFIKDCIQASDGKSLVLLDNHNTVAEPYAVTETEPAFELEEITPVGEPITAAAERWVACEIDFVSDKTYDDPVYTADLDVVFHHAASGKTLVIPGFWDGGTAWKVRFAPTEEGEWTFYTTCTDRENSGLHHRTGTVACTAYTGELDVYKHGFVTTQPGKSYFVHADGTPFFYLGDTYWTLPLMELDSYGSVETQKNAGITAEEAEANGITSQFTYIMDYRAAQGYTVIQSQPLGWWTNPGQNGWFADTEQNIYTYGVNDIMLEKFQQYDRYFAYIAEKGFVHSNTQFGYPTALMTEYFGGKITDEQLEKLCRYWVARYSAYPVMWATTQEGDNDYYGDRGDCAATPETNPWLKVFEYVQKYDAYDHPSTCHQEHWGYTSVKNSAFGPLDGHTWYAAQYNGSSKTLPDFRLLREYWNNPGAKPVVNYEGRYDHFWTGSYGSRAQGWLAFMNGQVGYGYGVQPIWNIFWSGNGITNWTGSDEWGAFNLDDTWLEGLRAEAGEQVTYIKDFLCAYEWWRLTPCFDQSYFYKLGRFSGVFCHIDNELYLGYCYGPNNKRESFGTLTAMENGDYEVTWFNCQTGEYAEPFTVTVTDGTYKIPARPGEGDWAISVKLVG